MRFTGTDSLDEPAPETFRAQANYSQDTYNSVNSVSANSADQPPTRPEEASAAPPVNDEAMLYCPVCSKRLDARKCKLFCSQCGYYLSCADYY